MKINKKHLILLLSLLFLLAGCMKKNETEIPKNFDWLDTQTYKTKINTDIEDDNLLYGTWEKNDDNSSVSGYDLLTFFKDGTGYIIHKGFYNDDYPQIETFTYEYKDNKLILDQELFDMPITFDITLTENEISLYENHVFMNAHFIFNRYKHNSIPG